MQTPALLTNGNASHLQIPTELAEFSTFPLYALRPGGKCACDDPACKRPGKHPAIRWGAVPLGQHAPDRADTHGRGLVCGRGLVVIDLDVRTGGKSGVHHFQQVALAHGGIIPATYTIATPSGGLHLYYRTPQGILTKTSAGEMGAGIDVRGDGGYVVIEGSPHVQGGTYLCRQRGPIAECPAWLFDLVRKREITHEVSPSLLLPIDLATPEGARRIGLFQQACDTYPESISGAGGHAALWNLVVFGARTLALPAMYVFETISTRFNPRCHPIWSGREIAHKISSAITNGKLPWNSIAPENWEEDLRALVKVREGEIPDPPILLEARAAPSGTIPPRKPRADHAYSFSPTHHVLAEGEGPRTPKSVSLADVVLVLSTSPVWAGVFQWDAFNERTIAVCPPCVLDAETNGLSDEDITRVQIWFERMGCKIKGESILRAIRTVAHACTVDPLREYVESLDCTGITVEAAHATFAEFTQKVLQAISPLADTFVRLFLLQAVRRAVFPGVQADAMLVLVGGQGVGKSTTIGALFGKDWYRSQMPDLMGRDASHALVGKWCVELGELDRVLRAESSTVKDFLSRHVDEYRAYGTGDRVQRPRRTVFVGTVNEYDFLRADHEFRRYWPVEIGAQIDVQAVREWRERLWVCAKACVLAGEEHFISDELTKHLVASVHEKHAETDPWEEKILRAIEGRAHVQAGEAYEIAFGTLDLLAGQKVDMRIARRVGLILRRAGWRIQSVIVDDRQKKTFVPPFRNSN